MKLEPRTARGWPTTKTPSTKDTALTARASFNFSLTGFAEKPSLEELAALSQRTGIPLVEDLGSGCSLIFPRTESQSLSCGKVSTREYPL